MARGTDTHADHHRTIDVPSLLSSALEQLGEHLMPAMADTEPPAELLVLGTMPLDGFLLATVRFSGRPVAEPPLAVFDPDRYFATYLGTDTRRSLGVLLGLLRADADAGAADEIDKIADACGFDPMLLPGELPLGVLPRVPPGWRLAQTADGVGVMAPGSAFAADQLFDDEDVPAPDPGTAVRDATGLRLAGHSASALWLLRNAAVYADPDDRPRLADSMAVCRGDLTRRMR